MFPAYARILCKKIHIFISHKSAAIRTHAFLHYAISHYMTSVEFNQ